MRNWLATSSVFLMILATVRADALRAAPRPAVIISSHVHVRSLPNLQAPTIAVLSIGDPVSIVEESGPWEQIGSLYGQWLRISFAQKTGWTFGPFISDNTVTLSSGARLWTTYSDAGGRCAGYSVVSQVRGGPPRTLFTAPLCPSIGARFSRSGEYLAFDLGTDIVGELHLFHVSTAKEVYVTRYSRVISAWDDEDCFLHKRVLNVGDGCYAWEEMKFCHGSLLPTGKKGTHPYHSQTGRAQPDC